MTIHWQTSISQTKNYSKLNRHETYIFYKTIANWTFTCGNCDWSSNFIPSTFCNGKIWFNWKVDSKFWIWMLLTCTCSSSCIRDPSGIFNDSVLDSSDTKSSLLLSRILSWLCEVLSVINKVLLLLLALLVELRPFCTISATNFGNLSLERMLGWGGLSCGSQLCTKHEYFCCVSTLWRCVKLIYEWKCYIKNYEYILKVKVIIEFCNTL